MTIARSLTILLILVVITSGIIEATAGGPLFWRIDNFSEVGRGELQGVTLDGRGAATLAPPLREVFDTKQAYIWSSVADQSGNIYLGTGNEGRVYRVDPAGKGELLYQTPELSVMALAVDARGFIYAGSSPDGKVYQISRSGEAKVFFDPKAKYIWALAFDPQGRLLVATGEKGVLHRVEPNGNSTVLATLGATIGQSNLTSLRVDRAGNILVGTDPGGMVVRVAPGGPNGAEVKIFTLFDSEQREIHDLALTSGPGGEEVVLALAVAESAGSGASSSAAAPPAGGAPGGFEGSVTVTLSDVQVVDSGSTSSTGSGTSGSSSSGAVKSILYRLAADGSWQSLWESRDAVGFSLQTQPDGQVLLGIGRKEKGRVLTLNAAGQTEAGTLVALPEGQVSRLIQAGGRTYAASSNLGKLYALGSGTLTEGVITGNVLDSVHHAAWGELAWNGSGTVEFQTRSGNTTTPDQTWSDWSRPLPPSGQSSRSARIESPAARYLQWRATLRRQGEAATPLLREVTIHYLPRNLAPRVTALTTLPIGVALQPAPPPSSEGIPAALQNEAMIVTNNLPMPPRRVFQQGALSLQWQGEDRNGDQLEYAIHYRLAAGSDWFTLRSGLRENYLTIDSKELPDESYVFRVLASDRSANPAQLALTGSRETETIAIDNTAPELSLRIETAAGARVTIRASASDRTTIIRRAEYQLDGGTWLPVFPVDGLADSPREEFALPLDLPDRRPHLVAVRVFDANSNIAIAQITAAQR